MSRGFIDMLFYLPENVIKCDHSSGPLHVQGREDLTVELISWHLGFKSILRLHIGHPPGHNVPIMDTPLATIRRQNAFCCHLINHFQVFGYRRLGNRFSNLACRGIQQSAGTLRSGETLNSIPNCTETQSTTYKFDSPPSPHTDSGGRLILRHRYVAIVHVDDDQEILQRERNISGRESSFGKLKESEWILGG